MRNELAHHLMPFTNAGIIPDDVSVVTVHGKEQYLVAAKLMFDAHPHVDFIELRHGLYSYEHGYFIEPFYVKAIVTREDVTYE